MKYLEITKIVRNLRQNMTASERMLWQELRNRKLEGKKFNRQHPIFYESNNNEYFFFVADFFCHESKLVIELDGDVHDSQKDRDYERDLTLQELGLKVLHIRNEELEDMEKVKNKIISLLSNKYSIPPLSREVSPEKELTELSRKHNFLLINLLSNY